MILKEPGDRRSTAGAGTDRTGGVAGAHLTLGSPGHTPNLYPGSSGVPPSGRGVPVPAARVVDGCPAEGIWWYPQVQLKA